MSGDGLDIANMIAEEVGPCLGPQIILSRRNSTRRLRPGAVENVRCARARCERRDGCAARGGEPRQPNHPDKYNDAPDEMWDQATGPSTRSARPGMPSRRMRSVRSTSIVILGKPTEEEEAMAQVKAPSMRRPTLRRGSRPSTQADSVQRTSSLSRRVRPRRTSSNSVPIGHTPRSR